MAIQNRRGQSADFVASKMVPGEFAVSQDNRKLYLCFAAGNVKEIAIAEDMANAIAEMNLAMEEWHDEVVEDTEDKVEDAEAWAQGTRGGTPVSSTDPTYQHNAKYYAENIVDNTLSIAGKAADAKKTGDEISDLKDDLNVISITPVIRNGSDSNPSNSYMVSLTDIQPYNGATSIFVQVNKSPSSNGNKIRLRFDTYSVAEGKTASSTADRVTIDSIIQGSTAQISKGLLDESSIGFAFSINEVDSSGNNVTLRVSDFSPQDVRIIYDYSDTAPISKLESDVDSINGNIAEIQSYVNFERWNLIDADSLHDGGMISDTGSVSTSYSDWSYTDYIPVKPSTTYTQCSTSGISSDISGGVYVAEYTSTRTFIKRTGGNQLVLTTDDTCSFVRLCVKTASKDLLCFGSQTLRLSIPTKYFDKSSFENNTIGWNTGYVVLTSRSNIIRFNNVSWKTTDYVYFVKGTYYVTPVSSGGGYITIYDTNLNPLSNTSFTSDTYGEIVLENDGYVTVSILAAQTARLISETQYQAIIGYETANSTAEQVTGLFATKKICFYGDSITCLGNDFRETSWLGILKNYFSFTNAIAVGIGGSHLVWTPNERYDFSSFTIGNNLPYGATRTQSDSGTIVSFCSWDRIEKTVPTDCDVVFVMGGTNDANTQVSGSTELSASNTTDSTWVSSDAYIGGDYDITTINGAILSIIMKMHVRCPNALVIMCTPMSGRGQTTGENQFNYASNDYTFAIAEAIKSLSAHMSCECFDLFGNSGITPYNRASYLYDTVHPNAEGMKLVARYLIEKFRSVFPRLISANPLLLGLNIENNIDFSGIVN